MKIEIKYIVTAFFLLTGIWSAFRIAHRVDRDKIICYTKDKYPASEVSYRVNYDSLVNADLSHGKNFLIGEAYTSAIVYNYFPYFRQKLDSVKTNDLIKLFNDSSSYDWGEIGTPEYPRTILYYDKNELPIGYTDLEIDGEADSYPYRSVMKWGRMTTKGYETLTAIIETEN